MTALEAHYVTRRNVTRTRNMMTPCRDMDSKSALHSDAQSECCPRICACQSYRQRRYCKARRGNIKAYGFRQSISCRSIERIDQLKMKSRLCLLQPDLSRSTNLRIVRPAIALKKTSDLDSKGALRKRLSERRTPSRAVWLGPGSHFYVH